MDACNMNQIKKNQIIQLIHGSKHELVWATLIGTSLFSQSTHSSIIKLVELNNPSQNPKVIRSCAVSTYFNSKGDELCTASVRKLKMQLKIHIINKSLPFSTVLKISSNYVEENWISLLNIANLLPICRISLNCWRTRRSGRRK